MEKANILSKIFFPLYHFCPLKAFPAALPVSERVGCGVRGVGGGVGCLDGGGEAVRAVVSIPKLGLQ